MSFQNDIDTETLPSTNKNKAWRPSHSTLPAVARLCQPAAFSEKQTIKTSIIHLYSASLCRNRPQVKVAIAQSRSGLFGSQRANTLDLQHDAVRLVLVDAATTATTSSGH